jgi:hypothetical protein
MADHDYFFRLIRLRMQRIDLAAGKQLTRSSNFDFWDPANGSHTPWNIAISWNVWLDPFRDISLTTNRRNSAKMNPRNLLAA